MIDPGENATTIGRDETRAAAETSEARERATLAGGCFWCIEPIFEQLEGVEEVEVGYSGGTVANPTYEQVCAGITGHAEAVQITFDPARIAFRDLLEVFFTVHDPTTLNRQGPDAGTQYRSAVFFHSPEQENVARQVIAEFDAKGIWERSIVTEVTPFTSFYRAEEYHQDYFRKNPFQPYCLFVIRPKVGKFRRSHLGRLRKK